MNWFKNLKIKKKLILGFSIMSLLIVVIGLFAIKTVVDINESSTVLYENGSVPLQHLAKISESHQKQRALMRHMFIVETIEERLVLQNQIKDLDVTIQTEAEIYNKSIIDTKGNEQYKVFEEKLDNYEFYRDETMEYLMADDMEGALVCLNGANGQTSAAEMQAIIDDMITFKLTGSQKQHKNNEEAMIESTIIMAIIVAVGIVLAIILDMVISNSISRPVNLLVAASEKLAKGDIEVDINMNTKDEVGVLGRAFASMVDNISAHAMIARRISEGDLTMEVPIRSDRDVLGKALSHLVAENNDILSNIKQSSEQVSLGARQLSDLSIALSQGATEQASAVEELTASMEEISVQTKLNAENASKANAMGIAAKVNAEKGNHQMKEMLKAMDDINISSNNINKIIKVIDDIAFQTNILALNAAVEAARVGQYGKGFAVVAEEVRTLAARSADAAKETTELIQNSIAQVDNGTRIARETAESLNAIVDQVEQAANTVSEIAVASNEQAMGVEQVNQGIMQVSNVVQTNSATSEEGAATSEELSSQAELLNNMVSKYKLKQQGSRNRNIDQLNPELLAMLQSMADKNRNTRKEDVSQVSNNGPKIVLSDYEFGKY